MKEVSIFARCHSAMRPSTQPDKVEVERQIDPASITSSAAPTMQRLFFALWPPEELRTAIHTAIPATVMARGARPVSLDNLHVTLAFLGAVPAEQLTVIRSVASGTHGVAFELTLDYLRTFRRSGVLCLAAAQAPSALLDLVATLRRALREIGCTVEDRPFLPHLTLARRVMRVPVIEVPPLTWTVQSFALVESRLMPRGSQYQIIDQWRLDSE